MDQQFDQQAWLGSNAGPAGSSGQDTTGGLFAGEAALREVTAMYDSANQGQPIQARGSTLNPTTLRTADPAVQRTCYSLNCAGMSTLSFSFSKNHGRGAGGLI